MQKIGNLVLIRLTLLSFSYASIVFTTSGDKSGNPCISYRGHERHGVIKVRDISKQHYSTCSSVSRNMIDILSFKENGDQTSRNLHLIFCTSPGLPEVMLQFKGTILRTVSGQRTTEVLSCRHFSDSLIIKTPDDDEEEMASSVSITLSQPLGTKQIGVLSVIGTDKKQNKKHFSYDIIVPASTILSSRVNLKKSRAVRDLKDHGSRNNPTYKPTDVSECGVTRGCFRYGKTTCVHYQCLYFVSYKVNTEGNSVDIELSGKTTGWIAIGFSQDDKMGDDFILTCSRKTSKSKDIKVMAVSNPLPNQTPKERPSVANLTHSNMHNGFIYCRMEVPIRNKTNDAENYPDLTEKWYMVYLKGPLSPNGKISELNEFKMMSTNKISVSKVQNLSDPGYNRKSLNITVIPKPLLLSSRKSLQITDQSECGKTRGCFRYGAESCGHFQCLYFLSYRVVGTDRDTVDIELSGKTFGWIALGFSSDEKMGGDDIIACIRKNRQSNTVQVKALSDQLPHRRPVEKPNHANLTYAENRDGFIYCRMLLPISRKSQHGNHEYLDLSNEWFQLYARGNISSVGEMIQHSEIPLTSSSKLTIFRTTVNVHKNTASINARYDVIIILILQMLLSSFPA